MRHCHCNPSLKKVNKLIMLKIWSHANYSLWTNNKIWIKNMKEKKKWSNKGYQPEGIQWRMWGGIRWLWNFGVLCESKQPQQWHTLSHCKLLWGSKLNWLCQRLQLTPCLPSQRGTKCLGMPSQNLFHKLLSVKINWKISYKKRKIKGKELDSVWINFLNKHLHEKKNWNNLVITMKFLNNSSLCKVKLASTPQLFQKPPDLTFL